MCAAANGFYKRRALSVPASEGSQTKGLSHPQHVVTIALRFLFGGSIELGVFQLQPFLELTIEVEGLARIEIDTDGIQLTLETHAVMVLYIIGVGSVATCRDSFQEVVLLVLLQRLVFGVGHEHLRINTGRVGTGLTRCEQRHLIAFLLAFLQIDQKTQLVERLVLIQVVELTGNLLITTAYDGLTDVCTVVCQ